MIGSQGTLGPGWIVDLGSPEGDATDEDILFNKGYS